ncbi:MAG: methyltransferase domain-containing protein [Blastocatellia bacterium]
MFDGFAHNFAIRSNETELIDGSDYGQDELIESLSDLRRINRWLGGKRALAQHLFPMIEAVGRKRIRLLDVGTGSADIPQMIVDWARAGGLHIEFVVLDLNEIAAREARTQIADYPEIKVACGDALNLPFEDGSFDFVLASLFLHHFETPAAAALLRSFARTARVAFLINDLRRHPLAYYSIKALSHIFTGNRLVRNDSAVSVLRGFTDSDIAEIAGDARVRLNTFRHFPYRYILIGQNDEYRRSPESF